MITLPINCTVQYISNFLSNEKCKNIYAQLTNDFKIADLKTKIVVDGKTSYSDYGKLMFIDQELYDGNKFPEELWGKTKVWTKELLEVKNQIEAFTQMKFHVCVCIYYPDGNSGVDFHSDYIAFGDTTFIPSLSLGEERAFQLREKSTQEIFEIILEQGSMIIMGEHCQDRYEHSLPTHPKYKSGRINLTFRKYGF